MCRVEKKREKEIDGERERKGEWKKIKIDGKKKRKKRENGWKKEW